VRACLALAVVLGSLLGAPPAIGASSFVRVATHPQASVQPTATGRSLVTLQSWNGRLYSGFGDYQANTGPIALTSFDGTGFASPPELLADTEAVYTFRVIDGKLYAPSIDPRVSSDFAVGTSVGGGASWSNPTVVGSAHAFDIVSLTGSDLWLVGASWNGDAVAWRSLDGGATWQQALAVSPVSGIAGDFARFYGAAVYQGKLYVQARDYYGAVHPASRVFDGTSWSDGPNLGTFNHARVFAGKLLYHGGRHAGWSSDYLKAFDGVSSRPVLSSPIYDYTIAGRTVYALGSDGWVRKSQNLTAWSKLAEAPAAARSIAIFNGSVYVGGTDSSLYKLPVAQPELPPERLAGAGDQVVTTQTGSDLNAFAGTFAWDVVPRFGRHLRLVLFSHGRRTYAPVRRFDGNPSLGPGRNGAPVAAYSRSNPRGASDLFVLGLRSKREHKLRALSTRRWSEDLVAVWGGRYVFRRECSLGRFCRRAGLFAGPPPRRISHHSALDLDLRGRVIALIRGTVRGVRLQVGYLSRGRRVRECDVATVGRLHAAGLVGADQFSSPVLTRRFVYWVASPDSPFSGLEPTYLLRRRIPGRHCARRGPVETLREASDPGFDIAVTQGRVFYTMYDPVTGLTSLFEMTDPLVRDP
jgi:hypothetical protein